MEISDESLTSWKTYPVAGDKYGVIQPTILQYPEGKLQILCRSRQNVITESWSEDGGKTWQPMQPIALPNPNSGIDAVSLQDGKQLLVYNPLAAGKEWWEGRSVLQVALSADGRNWKEVCTLEDHRSGNTVIQPSSRTGKELFILPIPTSGNRFNTFDWIRFSDKYCLFLFNGSFPVSTCVPVSGH